jgi:hypothetical protein
MEWERVDLREDLLPIRNQGKARACYAFVATKVAEHLHFKITGNHIELSPQYMYQGMVHSEKEDIKGRSLVAAFEWMKEYGCVRETTCPYLGTWNVPFVHHQPVIIFIYLMI